MKPFGRAAAAALASAGTTTTAQAVFNNRSTTSTTGPCTVSGGGSPTSTGSSAGAGTGPSLTSTQCDDGRGRSLVQVPEQSSIPNQQRQISKLNPPQRYHASVFRYTCYGGFAVASSNLTPPHTKTNNSNNSNDNNKHRSFQDNKGHCLGYQTQLEHVRDYYSSESTFSTTVSSQNALDMFQKEHDPFHTPSPTKSSSSSSLTNSQKEKLQQIQKQIDNVSQDDDDDDDDDSVIDPSVLFVFPPKAAERANETGTTTLTYDPAVRHRWYGRGKTLVHLLVLRPQIHWNHHHSNRNENDNDEPKENKVEKSSAPSVLKENDNDDTNPNDMDDENRVTKQQDDTDREDVDDSEIIVAVVPNLAFGTGHHVSESSRSSFAVLGPVHIVMHRSFPDHDDHVDDDSTKKRSWDFLSSPLRNDTATTTDTTDPNTSDRKDSLLRLPLFLQSLTLERISDAAMKNALAIQRNALMVYSAFQDEYLQRCWRASCRIVQQFQVTQKNLVTCTKQIVRYWTNQDDDDDDDDDDFYGDED